MPDDAYPVRWTGKQAVVTLPERIGMSNAAGMRAQLLGLVDQGASFLIADMTETVSCDHEGVDALLRVYQRSSVNGTRLRLAVSAPLVRRVLDASGLDRLISIYPSVETAVAAGAPPNVIPLPTTPAEPDRADPDRADLVVSRPAKRTVRRPPGGTSRHGPRGRGIGSAALLGLIDALADGLVLASQDGVIALANSQAEELFGRKRGELAGQPIESLIPAGLRAAHVSHRARYDRAPVARPMGGRARLVGLRKDGSTFPVQVSLSPVPTATGHFTLAVIRDASEAQPRADLGDLARAAAAARLANRSQELFDQVVNGLFQVGLSLQGAMDLPHDTARQQIGDALERLDDTIREIRDHMFTADSHRAPPGAG